MAARGVPRTLSKTLFKSSLCNLPNFPAFRGGVALGPFLKEKFGIPVFINDDGNLFAYGEALAGILPSVNEEV